MKARQVLAQYAAGERNFQGVNLRGESFKDQNLAGADFTGADIRGTDFTGADLTGVTFCRAQAGLPKRRLVFNLMIAFLMSATSGFLSWWPAALVALIFNSGNVENIIAGWVSLAVLVLFISVVFRKGVVAGLSTVAGALAVALAGALAGALTGAGAGAGAVAVALAGAVAGAIAVALTGTVAGAIAGAIAGTVAGAIAGAIAVALAGAVAVAVAVVLAVALAVVLTSLNLYIARRAIKGDPRDPWIRSVAVAFAAWGGTSFRGATLTDADFTKARLKNCDFRQSYLMCTCFQNTEKLDLSRPGETLLANTTARNVLINSEDGSKLDLRKANLRGAFLAGANLESANLKQADLSEADLSGAILENANLTESIAIGTNFTRAHLTGACLEAWNIEPTTIFKDVNCQYIYLRDHPNPHYRSDRRPHDPDETYQPGDFDRLYTQLMDTVEILLRDGINREAFATAFGKVMQDYPDITWDSIQAMEKKGKDVLVTVAVPPETDKAQLEKTFKATYEKKLATLKGKVKSLKRENKTLKQDKETMQDLLRLQASQPVTIEIDNSSNAASKAMSDNPSISVGGDVKGNLAGGDLDASGAVQNIDNLNSTLATTLNQLPETSPEADTPNLKTVLRSLQTAINTSELPEDDKAEALEQVQIIAEAGKNPQGNTVQKAVKRATTMLKGIIAGLPAAAGLVKAVQELLEFFDLG